MSVEELHTKVLVFGLVVHPFSVGIQFSMGHYGIAALGALAELLMALSLYRRCIR